MPICQYLLNRFSVASADWYRMCCDRIAGMVLLNDEKEERELKEIKEKEEEDLVALLAQKRGLPYINLLTLPIESDALRLLPEAEARAGKIAPFSLTGKKVAVALLSPDLPAAGQALEKIRKQGFTATVYMASSKSLEKVWGYYKELSRSRVSPEGAVEIRSGAVAEAAERVGSLPALVPLLKNIIESKESNRITRVLELLLGAAVAIDASDIHIEPEEGYVRLRLRLDGILEEALRFDRGTYQLLDSRIKLLSGLKLNIKNEAQDGRFSVRLRESDIEIRTSVLPGAYGESIVMRVLNPKTIAVSLDELGMHEELRAVVNKEISKPNGMLLTTGPTGSGKTTTLYAFLRKIHTPGVKIITIEDPIEYHLPGITQTQTNKDEGYTFASGLRSALRQDPDVIMVGEIRDEETAEAAINASLTGHLVFSTLHTNNAAGVFPRLIDLGVNPKVITSAVSLAMAQRLVRKLCAFCREEISPSAEDRRLIEGVLKTLPHGLVPPPLKLWKPRGCEKCNQTGYKGRTGVFEAIRTDSHIEKVIRENPSEREIAAVAALQGLPDMRQDGILKVLAGITSLPELRRVVEVESN